jgi:NAD(P)-dependent dehydrogenase (short-subunit alcohol dehydrogenase family)
MIIIIHYFATKGKPQLEENDWNDGMNVLTTAVFLGAKHAVPQMKKQGKGSIVNISSVHGLLMEPKMLTYEAGKAAIIAMTRQMAIDFGPVGVRVNAICPGHILTERIQPMWDENPSLLRLFEQQCPLSAGSRAPPLWPVRPRSYPRCNRDKKPRGARCRRPGIRD